MTKADTGYSIIRAASEDKNNAIKATTSTIAYQYIQAIYQKQEQLRILAAANTARVEKEKKAVFTAKKERENTEEAAGFATGYVTEAAEYIKLAETAYQTKKAAEEAALAAAEKAARVAAEKAAAEAARLADERVAAEKAEADRAAEAKQTATAEAKTQLSALQVNVAKSDGSDQSDSLSDVEQKCSTHHITELAVEIEQLKGIIAIIKKENKTELEQSFATMVESVRRIDNRTAEEKYSMIQLAYARMSLAAKANTSLTEDDRQIVSQFDELEDKLKQSPSALDRAVAFAINALLLLLPPLLLVNKIANGSFFYHPEKKATDASKAVIRLRRASPLEQSPELAVVVDAINADADANADAVADQHAAVPAM